ncbi:MULTISPECIES: RNase adapter RapZ [Larsenimonas]|uniref:RNase adapter RapZ n=1 Tax=Larsenimonas suaedae TaxID=1851019 RepID=A0ABU1GUJ3_9GAMM|nr:MULTISPECIES: RNase adapter RapZ [Larsenimonas]MCM2971000.1 RNase adapter RapZ [Larsenimonas suaedae]MCM5703106.1 RNase adapter RapZ [Larsenimonas salina]MDR5895709.1 RNase adapter RapZ [Larsenimonas suaedae]
MQLVIISGRSGSGKSVALQALEDLGFYAIDNLPATLLAPLIDELDTGSVSQRRIAVSIDARNLPKALERFPELLADLSKRIDAQVVYLTADARSLLERYAATRRRHPLTRASQMTLAEAIDSEQSYLAPIRNAADLVIDTTDQSVHELRNQIASQVAKHTSKQMTLTIESFGFKHGVPLDADTVFDARSLPNPYWVPALRGYTGRDQEVIHFLESHDEVAAMRDDIVGWLERWLPSYSKSNRSYFTVAIGCTGGQHRSVYLAERVATHFAEQFPTVRLRHREMSVQTLLNDSEPPNDSP